MAVFFRATVMLLVLVGLPTAWVYYGPLPPEAMGVIQRTFASAKHSLGMGDQTPSASWADSPMTAPKFETSLPQPTPLAQQPSFATSQITPTPTQPLKTDTQFQLASATIGSPATTSSPATLDANMAQKLEPHLSLLRSLNAEEYTLENWGSSEQLYRFRCEIPLGENKDFTQQFEAIHADPLSAVHQVVGEVTAWQNARHTPTTTRWQ